MMKFQEVADRLGVSKYAQDRAIVKKYTGAELTREQFDAYSSKLLLSDEFGNPDVVKGRYGGFGVPMEAEAASILETILLRLHAASVTLDFGPEGSSFRTRLESAARSAAFQSHTLPRLPEPYMQESGVQKIMEQE